jgi:hypothetical protein
MIELRHLFKLKAVVDAPMITPDGPVGERRFIPVLGGEFEGERLRGALQAGGSDCQLVRADGVADLDVRVTLQCDDGDIIFMRGSGMRHGPAEIMQRMAAGEEVDPSLYYFREALLFEAPSGKNEWLNRVLAIATGQRGRNSVIIDAFEVL